MAVDFITVNLEEGRPTAEAAIRRLMSEICRAKASGVKAMKLIHGYGSSGVGGTLRIAIRKELERLKKKGLVKLFVAGEQFDIFSLETIKLLDSCNTLRSDRDLGRYNNGITIALL